MHTYLSGFYFKASSLHISTCKLKKKKKENNAFSGKMICGRQTCQTQLPQRTRGAYTRIRLGLDSTLRPCTCLGTKSKIICSCLLHEEEFLKSLGGIANV